MNYNTEFGNSLSQKSFQKFKKKLVISKDKLYCNVKVNILHHVVILKEVWQEIMQGMAVKIIVLTLLLLGIIFLKYVMCFPHEEKITKHNQCCSETPPFLPTQTNFTL